MYFFCDEMINISDEKVRLVHDVFTSLPFKAQWTSYARLDSFVKHPEHVELLMEAGCIGLVFGIETLNKKTGMQIGKGLGERAIDVLEEIRRRDMGELFLHGNFMLGLPGQHPQETADQLMGWHEGSGRHLLDTISVNSLFLSGYNENIVASWKELGYETSPNGDGSWKNTRDNFTYIDTLKPWGQLDVYASRSTPMNSYSLPYLVALGIPLEEIKAFRALKKNGDNAASARSSAKIMGEYQDRMDTAMLDYANRLNLRGS